MRWSFWTPATGYVLLGQRGGMTSGKSFDAIEAWRTWPNHSVSGLTADGVYFTSARIREPDIFIEIGDNLTFVKVSGTIPPAVVGQETTIQGKYDYARSFWIDGQCVSVESTVHGDGLVQVAELYETLPVYLRDSKPTPRDSIEFQVGGEWTAATFAGAVQAVRLTCFEGAALITFDRPRRVKRALTGWSNTYLSRGTARKRPPGT